MLSSHFIINVILVAVFIIGVAMAFPTPGLQNESPETKDFTYNGISLRKIGKESDYCIIVKSK
jgi:hypothetical protein